MVAVADPAIATRQIVGNLYQEENAIPPRWLFGFVSWSRSRAPGSQMARLISAAAAATIPITEAVAAPVQKPLAQSSA